MPLMTRPPNGTVSGKNASTRQRLSSKIVDAARNVLSVPRNQSASLQSPMKKISDLFTDEEKKQLSYLGSMLHQEPTEEEQEQQKILDAWVDAKSKGPNAPEEDIEETDNE
jgi:hypothetical protein